MIKISKTVFAAIIIAVMVAAGGVGYVSGVKVTERKNVIAEEEAIRQAIGTWKEDTTPIERR
jgi:hypothetical protein